MVVIAIILGRRIATLGITIWVLIGTIGIPVFSNFKGGITHLVGATGGYIIEFIVMAYVVGLGGESLQKGKTFWYTYAGLILEYLIGMIQLAYVMQLDFEKTLVAGLYPFIIKDVISVSLGVSIALQVKKIIYKYIP